MGSGYDIEFLLGNTDEGQYAEGFYNTAEEANIHAEGPSLEVKERLLHREKVKYTLKQITNEIRRKESKKKSLDISVELGIRRKLWKVTVLL